LPLLPLPLPVAPPLFPEFPLPEFPLPEFPLLEFPLLEFPLLELSLDEPAAVAAVVVVVLDELVLLLVVLLLVATAVWVAVLDAVVVALPSLQTVSVLELDTLLAAPGATDPCASPCVTLWKFSFTSPSELEMRATPALG
jgi:hypothetical protein